MANNTGTFFNINDNDGIPLVGVSTDGKVLINHLYGNCLIGSTSVTGTASQTLQVTGDAYVSGSVGIGTTNPTSKLEVLDSAGTAGQLKLRTLGDVGIANTTVFLRLNDRNGNAGYFGFGGSVNQLDIWNYKNGPIRIGTNSTEALRIKSDGNVGIGTTNPARILDIYSASGSNTVKLTANGTSAGFIADSVGVSSRGGYFSAHQGGVQRAIFGVSGTWEGNTTSDAAIGAETGGSIRFYTNGSTEKARLDASGNLGIGIVNPQAKLVVNGSPSGSNWTNRSNLSTGAITFNDNEATVAAITADGFSTNGGVFQLYDRVSGDTQVHLNSAPSQVSWIIGRNVGIGTINPTSTLHVVGGDIRVGVNTSHGVILTAQNGNKYRLIVSNTGALSTVLV